MNDSTVLSYTQIMHQSCSRKRTSRRIGRQEGAKHIAQSKSNQFLIGIDLVVVLTHPKGIRKYTLRAKIFPRLKVMTKAITDTIIQPMYSSFLVENIPGIKGTK